MKKNSLTATTLRLVLSCLIVFLILVGAVGGYYLQEILNDRIEEASSIESQAQSSYDNLAKAQALKIYLQNHQTDISKTAKIVADTTAYRYQNQIVGDVTKYANLAGLTILGFDFPDTGTSATTSTSGLKSITANITLQNPVPYRNYLTFLKLIEQNLTKMQITDISITPDRDNPSLINNPTVGLEVYIK